MIAPGNVTERRIEAGGTTDAFTHTPEGTPAAIAVLVAGHGANSTPISVLTHAGDAMTKVDSVVHASTPFSSAQMWLIANPKPGPQTIELTKAKSVNLNVYVVTILADPGELTVDVHGSVTGTQKTQSVPLVATGPGLALTINSNGSLVLPYYHTAAELGSHAESNGVAYAQALPLGNALSTALKTAYLGNFSGATCGMVLKDPDPTPATEATIDGETGDLSQSPFIQALPGRMTVPETRILGGTHCLRAEIRQGDEEPDTGLQLCEVFSKIPIEEGTHLFYRTIMRLDGIDLSRWMLGWEVHCADASTPPLGDFFGDGEISGSNEFRLQNGAGSPQYQLGPVPSWKLGLPFERIREVVYSKTVGEIAVWHQGVPMVLKDGSTRMTGLNTLGSKPPDNDRAGLYRSKAAKGTAILWFKYWVTTSFFSDPPYIHPGRHHSISGAVSRAGTKLKTPGGLVRI